MKKIIKDILLLYYWPVAWRVCTGKKAGCLCATFRLSPYIEWKLRRNSFQSLHGGLDFKTGGTIGKPVRGTWLTGISHVYVSPMVRGMCLTSVITTAIPLSTAI